MHLQDEPFMDTIDPEVRADIEYAAKLLGRHIGRRWGLPPSGHSSWPFLHVCGLAALSPWALGRQTCALGARVPGSLL